MATSDILCHSWKLGRLVEEPGAGEEQPGYNSFKKYFVYVCENMHTHGGKREVNLWNAAFSFYLMSPETELRPPCLAAHAFIQ